MGRYRHVLIQTTDRDYPLGMAAEAANADLVVLVHPRTRMHSVYKDRFAPTHGPIPFDELDDHVKAELRAGGRSPARAYLDVLRERLANAIRWGNDGDAARLRQQIRDQARPPRPPHEQARFDDDPYDPRFDYDPPGPEEL